MILTSKQHSNICALALMTVMTQRPSQTALEVLFLTYDWSPGTLGNLAGFGFFFARFVFSSLLMDGFNYSLRASPGSAGLRPFLKAQQWFRYVSESVIETNA